MSNNYSIPCLQDVDLASKIVLVRVDHNVVQKGIIYDPYRIDATFGTLYYIAAKGGKVILMTHVGRPKDKKTGAINISEKSSVVPVVKYLENNFCIKFKMPEITDYDENGYRGITSEIKELVEELRHGKIDAIYLPNIRWFAGEEAKNETAAQFAYQLSQLADIFVNDAFGSWQAHASTVGITKYLPSFAGFLLQKEISNLERVFYPQKPFVSVIAGSKFDTKVDSLYALLEKSDHLVLGGVLYNAYLAAKYGITIEGIDNDSLLLARKFFEFSEKFPGKLVELPYVTESDTFESKTEGKYRQRCIRDFRTDDTFKYFLDTDSVSYEDKHVLEIFNKANTIFVNAVMGFTPHFNDGTTALYSLIAKNSKAMKLYAGGDTLLELKRLLPGLYMTALDNPEYYMFSGGGAVLKAIEDGSILGLEPVKALIENKKNIK